MKKLMFATVIAAVGSAFAVESSNVVGYQNFTLQEGCVATPAGAAFSPVAGSKWTCETKIFDTDAVLNDTVYFFNTETWNLDCYQFKGFDGTTGDCNGWAFTFIDTEVTWDSDSKVVQGFDIAQGDQIYYQAYDYMTGMTVAGAVSDTKTAYAWTCPAGEYYANIMKPWPVATTFAELETFAVAGDIIYVFNPYFWDLDIFQYKGKGNGWAVTTYSDETWDNISYVETDSTKVVMPAGIGGYYQPADTTGRTWNISL